jgi:glycerol-1-phosphate dehydrogenase [NAD(P)+]
MDVDRMKTLSNLNDYLASDSSGLANSAFTCPYCGRVHTVPIGKIVNGNGVLHQVPQIATEILGHTPIHPVLIYDRAIEEVIHRDVIDPLNADGFKPALFGVGRPGFHFDSEDKAGDEAADRIDPQADILIGAGSGVISDTTKWIATRLKKPFMIVGTAASMNGYTSITATITKNDVKVSEFLNPANAVILDADILAKAPVDMTQAGYGDLVARTVCNADWRLGNLIRGNFFCPLPYEFTAENERKFMAVSREIGQSDPKAVAFLGEAILKSGLSMTIMAGETSPSSGAEHVLSHYWDFLVHLRGLTKNFHGTQVGIASIIMLNFYEYMRELDPNKIDPEKLLRTRPTIEQIEAENKALYGEKAASFNKVVRQKYVPDGEYIAYVSRILSSWDSIWAEVGKYLAPADVVAKNMRAAGIPLSLTSIHRTKEEGLEALIKGSHYRIRYTLLDLAWELGILPDAAEEVLIRAGVL